MNELGKALITKRGKRSIRAIATKLDEPHANIQHVEGGRMPGPRLWLKLLRWLNVITEAKYQKLLKYTE